MTRDDWYALIADKPDDWATRLAFADWLEDEGDDVAANGQRWQVREQRYPWHSGMWQDWNWWLIGYWRDPDTHNDGLPKPIWEAIVDHDDTDTAGHWKSCRTIADADAALARALWSLGIVVRGSEVTA